MAVEYLGHCETYRAYALTKNTEGALFVVSNLDLIPTQYDPVPLMPEILLSLLRIGKAHSDGEDIGLAVQNFCNRYGQLGFQEALVQKTYDDGSVKFYPGNVLGRKAATKHEFLSIFIPFQREYKRQLRRVPRERIRELRFSENGEPPELRLDYSSCEAVEWYGLYGQQLYDLLRRFQQGEEITLLPGNVEARYELSGGRGKRKVYFDSLKSLCDFCMMETLASQTPELRLCKRCGKPISTHGRRMEYCSVSCRNVMNVQNSRRRKKEQAGK